jgi:hypothetical protein
VYGEVNNRDEHGVKDRNSCPDQHAGQHSIRGGRAFGRHGSLTFSQGCVVDTTDSDQWRDEGTQASGILRLPGLMRNRYRPQQA